MQDECFQLFAALQHAKIRKSTQGQVYPFHSFECFSGFKQLPADFRIEWNFLLMLLIRRR